MKVSAPFARLMFFIALATFFISCKKHSGSPTQCLITEVRRTDTSGIEMQLTYDSSRRLSMIYYPESGAKEVFTYSSNLMVRSKINNTGLLFEKDSIFLNSDGYVSSYTVFNTGSGKVDEYDSMHYDVYGQVTQITHRSTRPGYTWVESYGWDNGDAVMYDFDGNTGTYNYYTDKPTAQGDLNAISDIFKYGVVTKHCRHLFEGNKNGTVTYVFDKDNKITAVFTSGPAMPTPEQLYAYTYTCY